MEGVEIVKIERPRSPITFEETRDKMKVQVRYHDPAIEPLMRKKFTSPKGGQINKRAENKWYQQEKE